MIAELTPPAAENPNQASQHCPSNGDTAASRCGNRVRGALIGAVENVPPAQNRYQGTGCDAADKSRCNHDGADRASGIKITASHKLIEAYSVGFTTHGPAHSRTPRGSAPAQYNLLGFSGLARSQIDALAENSFPRRRLAAAIRLPLGRRNKATVSPSASDASTEGCR